MMKIFRILGPWGSSRCVLSWDANATNGVLQQLDPRRYGCGLGSEASLAALNGSQTSFVGFVSFVLPQGI